MKFIRILLLLCLFSTYSYSQNIVGGSGITKTNGNPNANPNLIVQDQRYEASFVWDTLNNILWRYNPKLGVGFKWQNNDSLNNLKLCNVSASTELTGLASFPEQHDGSIWFYNDNKRLVSVGGWRTAFDSHNLIFYSDNSGKTWTQASNPPFVGRHTVGFVRHNGYFYIIGGDQNCTSSQRSEIWRSPVTDGLTWTNVSTSSPFGNQMLHDVVSFNGKLYVIGGQGVTGTQVTAAFGTPMRTVYESNDNGVSWTLVNTNVMPNIGNCYKAITVHNGRVWLIAGGNFSTVSPTYSKTIYSTSDFVTWTNHGELPITEAGLQYPTVFSTAGAIWYYGGNDGTDNKNYLLYSTDGTTWENITNSTIPLGHAVGLAVLPSGNGFTWNYIDRNVQTIHFTNLEYCLNGTKAVASSSFDNSINWGINGNIKTTEANFLGTINEKPLKFRTNNVERLEITQNKGRFLFAQADANYGLFIRGGNETFTGVDNIGIGLSALSNLTTGATNLALGDGALSQNTTGNNNVALGSKALRDNVGGFENIGIGNQALNKNQSGTNNTAVGTESQLSGTTASYNTSFGSQSLNRNITGILNTAIGNGALYYNRASYNVAIGNQALFNNTTATYNVAIGNTALYTNTTGYQNLAIGEQALYYNNSYYNMAFGTNALYANTSGNQNMGIGAFSLTLNSTGSNNTAIGLNAMESSVSGGNNAAIGTFSLRNSTGNGNVGIGYSAGSSLLLGNNNISIGNNSQLPSATESNQISIGNFLYKTHTNFVGINTITPTSTFDVNGDMRIRTLTTGSNTDEIIVADPTTGLLKKIANTTNASWALAGNASTNPTTNFIGTTDAQNLSFRTNNTERMKILSTGEVQAPSWGFTGNTTKITGTSSDIGFFVNNVQRATLDGSNTFSVGTALDNEYTSTFNLKSWNGVSGGSENFTIINSGTVGARYRVNTGRIHSFEVNAVPIVEINSTGVKNINGTSADNAYSFTSGVGYGMSKIGNSVSLNAAGTENIGLTGVSSIFSKQVVINETSPTATGLAVTGTQSKLHVGVNSNTNGDYWGGDKFRFETNGGTEILKINTSGATKGIQLNATETPQIYGLPSTAGSITDNTAAISKGYADATYTMVVAEGTFTTTVATVITPGGNVFFDLPMVTNVGDYFVLDKGLIQTGLVYDITRTSGSNVRVTITNFFAGNQTIGIGRTIRVLAQRKN